MINNHLYSSQQTREPAWKRVMAALGSCAAAPTIVRITAAALTGMSHTHIHTHTFIDLKKYENIHTLRILSKKTVQFKTFAFGGWTPPPPNGTFSSRFYALFFLCKDNRNCQVQ